MTKFAQFALAAALVLSVGSFALAQSTPHGAAHSARAGDSVATKAFKDAHMKMGNGMDIAYSGNTDVDFVRGMIPHHQGAIDMAKVQLAHGKDPAIRSMAEKIIADQQKEIAQMQDWLKKNAK